MGSCSSGRAGRFVNQKVTCSNPSSPSCMLKCPWARYWTPNCSRWTVGTLYEYTCYRMQVHIPINNWLISLPFLSRRNSMNVLFSLFTIYSNMFVCIFFSCRILLILFCTFFSSRMCLYISIDLNTFVQKSKRKNHVCFNIANILLQVVKCCDDIFVEYILLNWHK